MKRYILEYESLKQEYSRREYFVPQCIELHHQNTLKTYTAAIWVPDTPSIIPPVDLAFLNGEDCGMPSKLYVWTDFFALFHSHLISKDYFYEYDGIIEPEKFMALKKVNQSYYPTEFSIVKASR